MAVTRVWMWRAIVCSVLPAMLACTRPEPAQRIFPTPEDAVAALQAAAGRGDLPELLKIFGPEADALVDTADPVAARQRREVFTVAMNEGWRLIDQGEHKALVVGNEAWPFPVPLTSNAFGWRFDTAAGKQEIIARRVGRNELAVIDICRRYVAAQRAYARESRDGKAAGVFAQRIRSDAGRQNGLYWPAVDGAPRSPLGDLVAVAEPRLSKDGESPAPFQGYYFRILTAQGPAATGGARSYVVNGTMQGGFALVAWPAQYDVTGIMTFVVSNDAVVYEKDLGRRTAQAVQAITAYDPDSSWQAVR